MGNTNTGIRVDPALRERLVTKVQEREQAVEQLGHANSDPLPGALYEAFARGAIVIREGLVVRKIVARDWVVLKGMVSPLLRVIEESQKSPDQRSEIECDAIDEWVICWIFTHPIQEVKAVYADGKGVDELKRRADEEIGDVLQASEVRLVMAAVTEHIRRSWDCALQYSVELQEKGEVTFFTEAVESPKTDSVGGSITSPASQPSASTA